MVGGGSPSGLPHLGQGAGAGGEDPSGEQVVEGGEHFGAGEGGAEGVYQGGEGGDQVVHGTGLLPSRKRG